MKINSASARFVLPLLLMVFLWVSSPVANAAPEGYWLTAYDVDRAFNDGWGIPHYGAFFGGINGNSQYFDGPSGAPSSYGSWDWWGDDHNVLLVEKTWLLALSCSYYGVPVQCGDRWNGAFHHAYMQ